MFPSFFQYATRRNDPPPAGQAPTLRHRAAEAPLTIRLARSAEPALDRLAELDGVDAADGPRLVAELDGRPVAALALDTGAAVADPFVRSAPLVELLRIRAAQLGALR
jgi:hypothetical protein